MGWWSFRWAIVAGWWESGNVESLSEEIEPPRTPKRAKVGEENLTTEITESTGWELLK